MDAFTIRNVKIEKRNAIMRHRRLRNLADLFRIIELGVLLTMISRFFPQIPAALKLSGDYFRGLSVAVLSPQSVFVIGNAIVIVLFLKSKRPNSNDSAGTKTSTDIYEEFVKIAEKNPNSHVIGSEHQKKEETAVVENIINKDRKIRRSGSEKLSREGVEKQRRQLKRSATDICRKTTPTPATATGTTSYPEDEMSSEEFRRTVEAFIARQQRLLREEEFSTIVSHY